jgi:hypothetical protein
MAKHGLPNRSFEALKPYVSTVRDVAKEAAENDTKVILLDLWEAFHKKAG